jgi:hypothetical protein
MTKVEKLQKVCDKILTAIRKNKNRVTTRFFFNCVLENTYSEVLDFYTPIFIKYNPEYASKRCELTVCEEEGTKRRNFAISDELGSYRELRLEEISDDMLNEMLAVTDIDEIFVTRYKQKSLMQEYDEHRQNLKSNVKKQDEALTDFSCILSAFALLISIIALVTSLC